MMGYDIEIEEEPEEVVSTPYTKTNSWFEPAHYSQGPTLQEGKDSEFHTVVQDGGGTW